MTSLFEDFRSILTETMYYGVVPQTANSYANVRDITDNKVNFFIIPPFDIKKYANKIFVLTENMYLRLKISESSNSKSE